MPENGHNSAAVERLDQVIALLRELLNRERRPPRLLRLSESGEHLHVSAWTLRRLIGRGELPIVKIHDGDGHSPLLVDVRDLDMLIERTKS